MIQKKVAEILAMQAMKLPALLAMHAMKLPALTAPPSQDPVILMSMVLVYFCPCHWCLRVFCIQQEGRTSYP